MKIFIITEGSKHIGYGHINRCISLYEAFINKDFLSVFIVNGNDSINELLKNKEYQIFDWIKFQDKLFELIKNADIIIIDSYLAQQEFFDKVAELNAILLCFDDNKRVNYSKGFVVNGILNAKDLNYTDNEKLCYLLGPSYTPLRKIFWNVPDKEIKEKIESIMLTFGGSDIRNLAPNVLKLLIRQYPELKKNVVIGKGYRNIREIENIADKQTNLVYYPDSNDMQKVMLESDIAISAAGQTLNELVRMGVPTIMIMVADNQINNVKSYEKSGCCKYAGWWKDASTYKNIVRLINNLKDKELRFNNSVTAKIIIDGKGSERIIKTILFSYFEKNLVLRKAESKDIFYVFNLSNDESVRKNSFNQEKILFKDHEKWFNNKIKDKNSLFLIAQVKNKFVGQLRYDINSKEAVINLSFNNEVRGKGAGKVAIQKSLKLLKIEKPLVENVVAFVKNKNKSSKILFEKSNFQLIDDNYKNANNSKFIYNIKIRK